MTILRQSLDFTVPLEAKEHFWFALKIEISFSVLYLP